jgi:hypothetical protein
MSLNALEAMIDPVNSPLLGPPTRPPRLRAPDLPVGGLFALGWASYPPTPKNSIRVSLVQALPALTLPGSHALARPRGLS